MRNSSLRRTHPLARRAGITETGRALTGHCGVGLLEDLAASQLPQALADLARLHPGATLEVLSLSNAAMREAYDAGRVQLVLDAVPDIPGPPRWTVRCPLVWAIGLVWTSAPIRCRWCCSPARAPGVRPCWRRWSAPTDSGGWPSRATAWSGARRGPRWTRRRGAHAREPRTGHGLPRRGRPAHPAGRRVRSRPASTDRGDLLIDAVETALRRIV
ncbi:hypothetical protein NKG94_02980 [Micromonospora sp. M12]